MLGPLGLDEAEEEIYRLLVARRGARISELALATGRTPASVRAVVESLSAQGLMGTPTAGPDPGYVPAPPGVTLAALLRQRQDDLRDVERAVADLVDQYRSPDLPHDVIEVLTDVADVRRRFFQIQEAARHEVLSMVVPNLTVVPHRENTAEIAGMKRGVRYRALLDRRALIAQNMQADVRASLEAGQEIRVVDEVPVKMMIVDGQTALLPLHSSDSPPSVLVHRSGLLSILIAFFETEWARAFPLGPATAEDSVTETHPADLDELDRQVLALLLSGLTDQALANQMGMSLRTVHRRIRQLMVKAGVESRIQLGWAAARNGWA
jgi:DNA-binding CsgD family transcriptional regulator/sugar-specific transcriptional regulator TrmB